MRFHVESSNAGMGQNPIALMNQPEHQNSWGQNMVYCAWSSHAMKIQT